MIRACRLSFSTGQERLEHPAMSRKTKEYNDFRRMLNWLAIRPATGRAPHKLATRRIKNRFSWSRMGAQRDSASIGPEKSIQQILSI